MSPSAAVWATVFKKGHVNERSPGTHKYETSSYMNTFEATDDWHKCVESTQDAYQWLTITRMDVPHCHEKYSLPHLPTE